jgi:hypothetical protein
VQSRRNVIGIARMAVSGDVHPTLEGLRGRESHFLRGLAEDFPVQGMHGKILPLARRCGGKDWQTRNIPLAPLRRVKPTSRPPCATLQPSDKAIGNTQSPAPSS